MNENNTTIATVEEWDLEATFTTRSQAMCTKEADTFEGRGALYNAINKPQHKLSDFINKTIRVEDVYMEIVEMEGRDGEKQKGVRTVLFDVNGESYACVSGGIYNALKKLAATFGAPTWKGGLPLEVVQIKKGDRSILTLNVALDGANK